jgi:DNA-binding MarR family transcriptional regulator
MLPGETEIQEVPTVSDVQNALHRVLKSLVFRNEPDSPLIEMPLSQLRCLPVIAEPEGQKMLDIAHRLEIKLPALSQIVDRLVRRGMVERCSDPHDRRIVRLALTPEARAILSDMHAARQARMKATVGHLSADAIRVVVRGLTLLAEAAEKVEAEERATAPPFSPDGDPLVEWMSSRARRQKQSVEMSPPQAKGRQ